jgi:hypothetical protein
MNKERKAFLDGLAADHGLPRSAVYLAASCLPESEDHDGLITTLEDMSDEYERGHWPAGADDDPQSAQLTPDPDAVIERNECGFFDLYAKGQKGEPRAWAGTFPGSIQAAEHARHVLGWVTIEDRT